MIGRTHKSSIYGDIKLIACFFCIPLLFSQVADISDIAAKGSEDDMN